MLLVALAPLSFRHSPGPSFRLPSSPLSCLAELDLTHMQLTPPAIQGLCQGLQQGTPWPALTTLSLEIFHFSRTQDRTFRAYASPVLPILQLLSLREMTPRFHTLRLGLLHIPSRGGQDDNTALKSLCSALRKLGPRLQSLDLSLPFMTKAAFTLLTTPSGGTICHHFRPLKHASFVGKETQGEHTIGESDEEGQNKENKTRAHIVQPPDYPLLQRLRLVVPARFEPEPLAFQKLIVGNCPSLEHVEFCVGLELRALVYDLLRVLLQLHGLRSLRLSDLSLGGSNSVEGNNRTMEEKEEEAKVQSVMSLFTEALAGGVWAARLCVLSLQGCGLDDDFLEKVLTPRALAGCPHLSTLDLIHNTHFSHVGCKRLIQALCVVKRAGLCPFLYRVDVGSAPGTHDEEGGGIYGFSPKLVKPALHKALHPFG